MVKKCFLMPCSVHTIYIYIPSQSSCLIEVCGWPQTPRNGIVKYCYLHPKKQTYFEIVSSVSNLAYLHLCMLLCLLLEMTDFIYILPLAFFVYVYIYPFSRSFYPKQLRQNQMDTKKTTFHRNILLHHHMNSYKQ